MSRTTTPRSFRPGAIAMGLLATAILALGCASVALGAPAPGFSAKKVVIVLVDDIDLQDLSAPELTGFGELARRGSVGLTTLPNGAPLWTADAYATIGTGVLVQGWNAPNWWSQGFEATETVRGETASAAYRRATGWPPPAGSILNPGITLLDYAFSHAGVTAAPGGLGRALHGAGLRTALVGNADGVATDTPNRTAALVAMDASGAVDAGAAGSPLTTVDPSAPEGMRTDFARLYDAAREALPGSSLVVIETGDLKRAQTREDSVTPEIARANRSAALRRTDAFLSRLTSLADKNTLLLVIGTSVPGVDAQRDASLAPVIAVGDGVASGGILQSGTTHVAGLVTLYDVAPTVLAHVGVAATASMVGQPITSRAEKNPQATLASLLDRAATTRAERRTAVTIYVWFQVLLLLALSLWPVQSWVLGGGWRWVPAYGLGTTALALLLLPLAGSQQLALAMPLAALLTLALAFALTRLEDPARGLFALSIAVIGVVALDLLTGGTLARSSFLGYDIIAGSRFYGIGNELEGLLVGAGVIGAACTVALAETSRGRALAAAGLGSLAFVALMAWPTLGADAGGTLSAAVGCGVAFYGLAGGRYTWRRVIASASAALALAIATLFLLNVTIATSPESHVGRFLDRLLHGDFGYVAFVLTEKATRNMHLLTSGIWRWILAASAVALVSLWFRNRDELRLARARDTSLWYGLVGLSAGGVSVFMLNDSGVVALATLAPLAVILMLTMAYRAREP